MRIEDLATTFGSFVVVVVELPELLCHQVQGGAALSAAR